MAKVLGAVMERQQRQGLQIRFVKALMEVVIKAARVESGELWNRRGGWRGRSQRESWRAIEVGRAALPFRQDYVNKAERRVSVLLGSAATYIQAVAVSRRSRSWCRLTCYVDTVGYNPCKRDCAFARDTNVARALSGSGRPITSAILTRCDCFGGLGRKRK